MDPIETCGCCRRFGSTLLKTTLLLPFAGLFGKEAQAQHKAEAPPPGSAPSMRSHVLDTGADVLQSKKPFDAMSEYLNGFHF